MKDVAEETIFWWFATLSGISLFVITAVVVPWLIVKIPADYFVEPRYHRKRFRIKHPVLMLLYLIIKNILGTVFLAIGITMLFLPGPGLATMVLGIILLDLPKKNFLLMKLIRYEPVLRSINWLRHKANEAPLKIH